MYYECEYKVLGPNYVKKRKQIKYTKEHIFNDIHMTVFSTEII